MCKLSQLFLCCIAVVFTLSCESGEVTYSSQKVLSFSPPTPGNPVSEISFSGALMIESVGQELLGAGYSLNMVKKVVERAKVEVEMAGSLAFDRSESTTLSLSGTSSQKIALGASEAVAPVSVAAEAVAKGAVLALGSHSATGDDGDSLSFTLSSGAKFLQKMTGLSFNHDNVFTLAAEVATLDTIGLIARGQVKGIANLQNSGQIQEISSDNLGKSTKAMASTLFSASSQIGVASQESAGELAGSVLKTILTTVSQTDLKENSSSILAKIPEAVDGFKELKLPANVLTATTQTMVEECVSVIKNSDVKADASALVLEIVKASVSGAYSAAASTEAVAESTANTAKVALLSITELVDQDSAVQQKLAENIFNTAVKTFDNLPNWDLSVIAEVTTTLQSKAVEAVSDLGLTGDSGASILSTISIGILGSVGEMNSVANLGVDNYTLKDTFTALSEATLADIRTHFPDATVDYSATLEEAVHKAATNTIAINTPPVLSDLLDFRTDEDTPLSVSINISDAEIALDCSALKVTSVNTDLVSAAGIKLSGAAPICEAIFSPKPNLNGSTLINLALTDGFQTTNDSFLLVVTPVNDPPAISKTQKLQTPEETPISISLNISDIDSELSCSAITASSSHMSLISPERIQITGTAPLCQVVLNPKLDQYGKAAITLTVTDGVLSTSDTFEIEVTPVNDPPVIGKIQDKNIREDGFLQNQIVNISDVDSTLDCSTLNVTASNPTLIPPASLAVSGTAPNCLLSITPVAQGNGTSQINLKISDQTLSSYSQFFLSVEAVNDPPEISAPSSKVLKEDVTGEILVTISDIDSMLSCASLSAVSSNQTIISNQTLIFRGQVPNCSLELTPSQNQNGSLTIDITVSDGELTQKKSLDLLVEAVNDSPFISDVADQSIAEDTALTLSVRVSDIDSSVDCGLIKVSSSQQSLIPTSGMAITGLSGLCTLRLTPILNEYGRSLIKLTVSDGLLTAEDTFNLDVSPVNDPPVISDVVKQTILEDSSVENLLISITDVDSPVNCLGLSASSSNQSLLPDSSVTITGTAPACQLSLKPTASYSGRSAITLTLSDGVLVSSSNFTLDVLAINDPPTDISLSSQNIGENAGTNAEVGILLVTDADLGDAHGFTLVQGLGSADNSLFNILNGRLRLNSSADFETKSTYAIRIKVTDAGGLSFEKPFVISVINVNESPTNISLSAASIAENNLPNAIVGSLSTTDSDLSETFNYALSGLDANAFTINSGILRISQPANFESKSSYSLTITTTDSGGLTFSKPINILITNVNESPLDIALSSLSIAENNLPGASVGNLSTTDNDQADSFTYSLGGSDSGSFQIVGSSLRLVNSANFELKSSYALTLTSTDSGGLSINKAFTINVLNVNEAPTDVALSSMSIPENNAPQAIIGTMTTIDSDLAETFSYKVTGIDAQHFVVNGASLILLPSANFEAKSSYSIGMTVTDLAGLTYSENFTISITDLNEAPSDILLSSSTIAENNAANAVVGVLSAVDIDIADSHAFSLSGVDATFFNLSGNSLRLTDTANFEVKSSFQISVTARDSGGMSVAKNFTIAISNLNEAPTDLSLSSTTISENNSPNTVIGVLTSVDSDASESFTYSISGLDSAAFNVSTSGALRLAVSADYETKAVYAITITTRDSGGLTFSKAINITVTNVNEAPTGISLSSSFLAENNSPQSVVGVLATTDSDLGDSFFYTISGIDAAMFAISGQSLVLTQSTDFETKSFYSINITTVDAGGLTYSKSFTITITNINESPTDINLSSASLAENNLPSATVGLLSASDLDGNDSFVFALSGIDAQAFLISGNTIRMVGPANFESKSSYNITVRVTDSGGLSFSKPFVISITNLSEAPSNIILSASSVAEKNSPNTQIGILSTLDDDLQESFTYTLSGLDASSFKMTSDSLIITTSADFQIKSSYYLTITSTDSAGLSFTKNFTISVLNLNDAPTDIALSSSSIAENNLLNSIVGLLSTTDNDPSDSFTYTLSGPDAPSFAVAANSLKILVASNYEAKASYSLSITSTDGGGLTVSKPFTISITNVNEAPTDVALSSTSIIENNPTNAVVGLLSTSDSDPSDTFTYSLTGVDASLFVVSGDTLRILSSANFELKSSYSLTVTTRDAGGMTFSKPFIINVVNQNEAPTDISLSSLSIAENNLPNTVIGLLSTLDSDLGDSFTYALSGPDAPSFAVAANSLKILVTSNYEAKASYTLTITSTDAGGLTVSKPFTISITNVNEAPTDVALSSASIVENNPANTAIGLLSTSDSDLSDTFTYGLTGADASLFAVSGDTLRILSSANFELKSSYSLTVTSRDAGGMTFSKPFIINVVNQNEAPTDISLSSLSIAENNLPNTVIGLLSTIDGDLGDSINYTIAGLDVASFAVIGNSLILRDSANYESKSSYNLNVIATDSGGLSFSKMFTISVMNVNESPTDIFLSSTSIPENNSINAVVGRLSTLDGDIADSFAYTIAGADASFFAVVNNDLKINVTTDFEVKAFYSIMVTSTDSAGLMFTKSFVIEVTNINESPSQINLSRTSIVENNLPNDVVGLLTTSDSDNFESFSYSLSGLDAASFTVVGDSLRLSATANYEVKNFYAIAITVTDAGGLSFTKTFDISVTNINEPPIDLYLSKATIPENNAPLAEVGLLSTLDGDQTHSFVYTIGGADAQQFAVLGNSLRLTAVANYEMKSSYSIDLTSTDSDGLSITKTIVVQVSNVNEPPTDISLSQSSIAENNSPYSLVGEFSSTDSDLFDTFNYVISGQDAAFFEVENRRLSFKVSSDYENKSVFSLVVTATDSGGLAISKSFDISILNLDESPVLLPLAQLSTLEDTPVDINLIVSDQDGNLSCSRTHLSYQSASPSIVAALDAVTFSGNWPNCTAHISPQLDAVGSTSLTIYLTDGGQIVSQSFVLTVQAVNDLPTMTPIQTQSVLEDGILTGVGFTIFDQETSLSCSNVSVESSNYLLIDPSRVNIFEDSPGHCSMTLSPLPNQTGEASMSLSISDGTVLVSQTFMLFVTSVNDAPFSLIAGANTYTASEDDPTFSLWLGSFMDVDSLQSNLNYVVITPPLLGTLGVLPPVSPYLVSPLSYTPFTNANGTDTLVYKVCDEVLPTAACSQSVVLTINLLPVNDAPALGSIADLSTEFRTSTSNIALTVSDIDGPVGACDSNYLSYASSAPSVIAAAGAVSWSGVWPNCTAVFTPTIVGVGSSVISVVASDGTLLSSSKSFTLTVKPPMSGWYQEAYLKSSNIEAGDAFASVAVSGDTVIVGAFEEDSNQISITNGTSASTNNSLVRSGAGYIFRRSGVIWAQEAYLKASNASAYDSFGRVAISGDTAVVGAPAEASWQTTVTNGSQASPDDLAFNAGAAYVYKRVDSNWFQEAYLKASNSESYDSFGSSISVSGETVVVGVPMEDSALTTVTNGIEITPDNSSLDSGAAYVFRRQASQWQQEAYLKAFNSNLDDRFGSSVAVSGDTVIVGAMNEDSGLSTVTNASAAGTYSLPVNLGSLYSGASYIFRRIGSVWFNEAYLKPSNTGPADNFGLAVALSGDTAIVGSNREDSAETTITNGSSTSQNNSYLDSGASYIFNRNGSNWSQQAYIKASNAGSYDSFGLVVAISGDTAVVGAMYEDAIQSTITNGLVTNLDNAASDSGAAYVYRRTGTSWLHESYLKAANAASVDWFGTSVAISGDTIVVGATGEDSAQSSITNGVTASLDNFALNSGAVYVYRSKARLFEPTDLVASSANSLEFSVNWLGSNLGTGLASYKVVYDTVLPNVNCSSGLIAYTGNSTSVVVTTGLNAGQKYFIRICSFDGANYSPGATAQVTVKAEDVSPSVISITRGSTLNPVPSGTALIDYRLTFSEPVVSLSPKNLSFSEVSTTSGATGYVKSISCALDVCTVWVSPGNRGQLRLDLNNPVGVTDRWGNPMLSSRTGDETYDLTGLWQQEAYLKASNTDASDSFSLVGISGDTVIVGAPDEDSSQTFITNGTSPTLNNLWYSTGASYIFRRSGSVWIQEAYLKASNAYTYDAFARSAISGDTAVVGAPSEDSSQTTITNGSTASADDSAVDAGAAYVFKRNGSLWSQEAYLKASNPDPYDSFGSGVSISGDLIVVGAPSEDASVSTVTNEVASSIDNSSPQSGASYIFRRRGTQWIQEAVLKAFNNNLDDRFGFSVAVSGEAVIVGAYNEDSGLMTVTNAPITGTYTLSANTTASTSGAAYIYRRVGSSWVNEAYLKASNVGTGDNFGYSVALSGDTALVGSYREDSSETTITNGITNSTNNSMSESGAAYIFSRNADGWTQQAYLKASNTGTSDYFGQTIALSGDTAVVGASYEDSAQTAITNGLGMYIDNGAPDAGAAYVYRRIGSNWVQESYLKAANAGTSDWFGSSVAISGDTVVVAASGEDSSQTVISNGIFASPDNSATSSGAVYVFRNKSRIFEPTEVVASSPSASAFSLQWNGTNIGTGISYYKVVYDTTMPAANCSSGITAYTGNLTSVLVNTDLISGQNYFIRICSSDGTSFSPGATTQVTVKADEIAPTVISIMRGSAPNPVPFGTTSIDYIVSFSEPVVNLTPYNFSVAEVSTSTGASGVIKNVSCVGATCTVWVAPGNMGQLRLDLSSTSGIYDRWGNAMLTPKTGDETYQIIGAWVQEAYIKPPNPSHYDYFGFSLATSGDSAIVGAFGNDSAETTITNGTTANYNNYYSSAGASYIYRRSGNIWRQEAYLKASNASTSDYYGYAVAISGDTAIVGSYGEDASQTTIINGTTASTSNSLIDSGASYIYARNGLTWNQEAFIKASDAATSDWFGRSVAVYGDTALVGAPNEGSLQTTVTNGSTGSLDISGAYAGAAYVYRREGSAWSQQAYLKASNAGAGDYFGTSVALSMDTALVTAYQEDSSATVVTNGSLLVSDELAAGSGAAYFFRRSGPTWIQEAYLKASNARSGDYFGFSGSVSQDTVVIGALQENSSFTTITNGSMVSSNTLSTRSGASYIFRRNGSIWMPEAYLKASNANSYDQFGRAVAISGNTLVVGAQSEDSSETFITNGSTASANNLAGDSGASYIFRRTGYIWSQESYLKASNANANDYFGSSVAISGDTVLVGAYLEDSNQTMITNGFSSSTNNMTTDSGAVYVYRNKVRMFDPEVKVSAKDTSSITFSWYSNLGSTNQVKIAPASLGQEEPPSCEDPTSLSLGSGATSYVYSGLASSTSYAFRICAFDGTSVSAGTVLRATTN